MAGLPVIDFEQLDPKALRAACEDVGFFYLSNHGLDPRLEATLEHASREFFALPLSVKNEIAMVHGGTAWRGYFPLGGELTSGLPDMKEGLYFGQERPPDSRPMHGPNLFHPAVPALRDAVLAWVTALEKLGQEVLRGIAKSLELDGGFFEAALTREPVCLFRIFHYPALTADARDWSVGEHTDYGLLTLLKQDDCGGLEVKTRHGWWAAPPIEGTLVCNLGDMLDRITGGRYRSTPHRVRNTSGRGRFSWPFFLDPSFDAEVRALPGALVRPVDLDAAERWDRASVHSLRGTYGEYLQQKVAKVFPDLATRA